MKRIRPVTVLLLALILVLGAALAVGQRREARLRAALAQYKQRAGDGLRLVMGANPSLEWPEGTPLRKVISWVVDSAPALRHFPRGLPLLVDADGLREAGRTLDSPVGTPPKDPATGDPLSIGRQLGIALEPLGLAAEVRDGAIVITSRGRVDGAADAAVAESSP